jgi:2-phosphoglycerate kinase
MPTPSVSLFKDSLQLDQKYKSMIHALVDEHRNRGVQNDPNRVKVKDVVKHKGKGLVLLFHGPPGVGKTVSSRSSSLPFRLYIANISKLTAETIAETTRKPLFIVSVAEIGLDASKAERNLEQMFHLAGKWEAILLV